MDGSTSYRGRLWSSMITSRQYVTQMNAWKRPYVPHVSFLNYTIFILHCPCVLNLLCVHQWCNESARQRYQNRLMPTPRCVDSMHPRVVSYSNLATKQSLMMDDIDKIVCPPRVVSDSTMTLTRSLMMGDIDKLVCPPTLCQIQRWLSHDGWWWTLYSTMDLVCRI